MNRKFQSLIYTLSQGNPKILLVFLISALFVTIVRALAPIALSWDPTAQILAANNLIQGLGITLEGISPHLNEAAGLYLLTAWPPGFPLIIALFLAVGFSLATSLKIIYSITTMIGWLGWGIIGCYCLRNPLKISSIVIPAQFALAAILPLFYTPRWNATDIFLWAGVPFVVLLLFNSVKNNVINNKIIIIAGIISGVMIYFRYMSAFLLVLGFAIIFQKGIPNIKTVFKSSFWFFLASGLSLLPLVFYLRHSLKMFFVTGHNLMLTKPNLSLSLWQYLLKILQSASVISNISGLPLQKSQHLNIIPNIISPVSSFIGLISLIIIFLLPLLAYLTYLASAQQKNQKLNLSVESIKNNLYFSISMIPIFQFLLLLIFNLRSSYVYDFVGTSRYYIASIVPTILLAYKLATSAFSKYLTIIKYAFLLLIIGVIVYNFTVRLAVSISSSEKGSLLFELQKDYVDAVNLETRSVLPVMFMEGNKYPSNEILNPFPKTMAELEKLQHQNPKAIFFAQKYNFALNQQGEKTLKIQTIPDATFWDQAHVDEKTLIFWEQSQNCPHAICNASFSSANVEAIDNFSDGTIVEKVFESSQEKTKIIKTYFPKATKIKK